MANLGQTLLKRNLINLIQLNLALDFKVFYGGRLGTNLLELGILQEEDLAKSLSESLGLPYALAKDLENVSPHIIQKIPREVAFRTKSIPFRFQDGHLYVAMIEPKNYRAYDEVRKSSPHPILAHITPELRAHIALEYYYQIRMNPRMKNLATKLQSIKTLTTTRGTASEIKEIKLTLPPPIENVSWVSDDGPTPSFSLKPAGEDPGKVTLSVQKISWLLEMARTRDEIAEYILQFSQMYLKRVALFVLRKEMGFGWDGRGEEINRSLIRSIVIPLNEASIFRTVVQSQGHFLGTVPKTRINNEFLSSLGAIKPPNILLLPLTLGGITFGALYGDNGKERVDPEGINELQVMISRANIAFERLIISEREKALRQHASI